MSTHKILLINVVENKGSTGNITTTLYNAYKELGNEPVILYGRKNRSGLYNSIKPTIELESKIHHFLSLFTGNMYGGMHLSTLKIINKIKHTNPDIIHLHCLNGYFVNIYSLIKWLKKQPYKVILTMHADFMLSANCGYTEECDNWKCYNCKKCKHVKEFNGKYSINRTNHFFNKMKKAFFGYPKDKLVITGVSPWLSSRIKESPIYQYFRVETVLNPVDDFYFDSVDIKRNNKQILYVTPDFYDKTKSGHYLLDIAKRLPDYHFVLVDSKEQEIVAPNNVEILYHPSKEKIRELYHSSRYTLILSKRETFSMVAAESIICGTPVIGFKNGGTESWIDDASCLVEYGDVDKLSNIIAQHCLVNQNYYFCKKEIAKCYIKLFIND